MVASSVVEDPLGLATSFKADTLAIIEVVVAADKLAIIEVVVAADTLAIIEVVVMADKLAITEVGEEEEVVSLDKLALVLAF